MDSDLREAVQAFKKIFEVRFLPANFGKNDKETLQTLAAELELTPRFTAFLSEADPLDVETVTPSETVRFISAADLIAEQVGYGRSDADNPKQSGWRAGWIVIGHSALGDPYFLDTTRADAEGDCPVMTLMSGSEEPPTLCATSFVTFLQILSLAMEVAEEFGGDAFDPDDEQIFREALRPKIRVIDQAALRHGHWT